ncbi:MAG: D-alanyl-D-alanine carboxypeptidase [Clostridiales bacterium]|nr:D-alanyl-D-alanine carboxypeptidase [Clostridiales bacterium]
MGRKREMRGFIWIILLCVLMIASYLQEIFAAGSATGDTPLQLAAFAPEVKAKSAILLDAGTGTILYEQNSHEALPPASVTKVMTMLLALEAAEQGKVSLEDPVTISPRAASMGGSQMYMEAGEQHTLGELLKGMAMASANDACVACAEFIGGSEETFVELMNRRAKELGMEDTHFVNTNGLPVAGHVTSAYDIGIMSRELLKHEAARAWFTTWQDTVSLGKAGKEVEFGLTNTNRLIKLYSGANGIKTGFTQDAGYCLSGSATRDGLTLIAVVMGCETTGDRWSETMRLLDHGFANYESICAAEAGQSFGSLAVEKGREEQVEAVCKEPVYLLLAKGQSDKVQVETLLQKSVKAPVAAGDPVGELVVTLDGRELQRVSLTAACDVPKASFGQILQRMLGVLLSP